MGKLSKQELGEKKLSIKLFGSLRSTMNLDQIKMDLDKEITVSQMKKIIFETFPNLKKSNIPFFVAVNHKYAPDSLVVGTNDEIALIPPVSGG